LVATLEQVFREEWGRVLATLIGVLGDFDLAEDAAQEAPPGAPPAGISPPRGPPRRRRSPSPPTDGHATASPATRAPG
jgi:predicted RNA polymerase sigma factor